MTRPRPSRFAPNIGTPGRLIRGLGGLVLLIAAIAVLPRLAWLGVILLVSAVVVLFEATRGWCVLRACGIKTKF